MRKFWKFVENNVPEIFLCVFLGLFIVGVVWLANYEPKTYPVHGRVIEKFRTDAGYKVSPEAHVVIYSDSLKRNVDIKVTWQTYVNAEVGETLYFRLTEYDLSR